MREIKFRAWDEGRGVMWYPDSKSADGNGIYFQFFNWGIGWGVYESVIGNRLVTGDPKAIFNTPGKLMQYTGLKDKNGKEIYERDIVRIIDPSGEKDKVCEVRFVNGGFVVEASGWFYNGECDITTVGWAIEEGIEIEVIGNIYESPELIK